MSTQPAPSTHGGAPGPNPAEQLLQISAGYIASACLSAAAELKIADLLAGGPKPVSELAAAAGANEEALYRILRALAPAGVFTETAPRTFANTPASDALRSGAPQSVRDLVIWLANPFHLRFYGELMHCVKTGGSTVKRITGMEAFEYLGTEKALAECFNAAMTNLSAMILPVVLEAYDFGGLGTLADIAGGHGFLLTGILQKHPNVQGVLFDMPQVVSGAAQRIESLGLGGRCRMVGGDFFQSVPAADNYVMKHIIHDWDDEKALRILQNCARAMNGKGKVILIESVLAPGNEPHFGKWMDIEMMAIVCGRERTEAEFAALFSRAGLRLARMIPTKSPVCVIEAVKV